MVTVLSIHCNQCMLYIRIHQVQPDCCTQIFTHISTNYFFLFRNNILHQQYRCYDLKKVEQLMCVLRNTKPCCTALLYHTLLSCC
ncbi:hypothetical protein XELAEV_18044594mg [Xenopus laevis]|uniref:Uncharacterized protein n=1 Tax=Xenopus laevis TaxID=8355 RepID=A0A974BZP6_XENLA|nr:hypothetical protein XELAEV_18044594mg [Xenopus laevis]